LWRGRGGADEHVGDLVFVEASAHVEVIADDARGLKIAGKAHFFAEAARGGRARFLAGPGMPAAGVRPEAGRVVLAVCTSLHQQLAGRVADEDGDGAMQTRREMGAEFFLGTALAVVLVDKDDTFVERASRFLRLVHL
jgi:hypothetical protein